MNIVDFEDYCPNGLQVEAGSEIKRLVSGVTACQALIDAAIERDADAILVHHGYFWKNESPVVTGMKGKRIRTLLNQNISLLAYHLPLDAHPEIGNNRQLGVLLGVSDARAQNAEGLLWGGEFGQPLSAMQLSQQVSEALGRKALLVEGGDKPVTRLAWCTGGAQSYIDQAADLGFDAFISGEISESTVHIARERGIHYLSAGHHATERYGVQALAAELEKKFDIEHEFVDIDNPV